MSQFGVIPSPIQICGKFITWIIFFLLGVRFPLSNANFRRLGIDCDLKNHTNDKPLTGIVGGDIIISNITNAIEVIYVYFHTHTYIYIYIYIYLYLSLLLIVLKYLVVFVFIFRFCFMNRFIAANQSMYSHTKSRRQWMNHQAFQPHLSTFAPNDRSLRPCTQQPTELVEYLHHSSSLCWLLFKEPSVLVGQ